MTRLLMLGITTVLINLLFVACGTATLQTKAKLTRTITLDHSKKENKNIYLQVTNTAGSGGENMQLFQSIKNNLQNKGYAIVENSTNVGYGLFVNVLFANNLKEAKALQLAAGVGSTMAVGAVVTGQGGRDSLVIGVAAALGGAIVGKALEDDTFRAVVDVTVRDYSIDTEDYKEIKTT